MIDYHEKMERVLDQMGGVYTLDDIISRINKGDMQSFVSNNSWAITECKAYPRRVVLDIVCVVGDFPDLWDIYDDIFIFAEKLNVTLIRAFGRPGWARFAGRRGWYTRFINTVYERELYDGRVNLSDH